MELNYFSLFLSLSTAKIMGHCKLHVNYILIYSIKTLRGRIKTCWGTQQQKSDCGEFSECAFGFNNPRFSARGIN